MKCIGEMDEWDVIYGDLAESVLPASNLLDRKNETVEAPQDSRFQIARTMHDFRRDVAEVRQYSQLLQSFAHRCRFSTIHLPASP